MRTLEQKYKNTSLVPAHLIARILPLPGVYGGLVESVEQNTEAFLRDGIARPPVKTVHGINLLPGEDHTTSIPPPSSAQLPIEAADSDIHIFTDFRGRPTRLMVLFASNGDVPWAFGISFRGESPHNIIWPDLKGAIESGRRVLIHPGSFIIPVADPRTNKVTTLLEYKVPRLVSASWDKSRDNLVWEGLEMKANSPEGKGSK